MRKSNLEESLALQLRALKIEYEREYVFHPTRRWRFDFTIPELKIFAECQGGIWTKGGHSTGTGIQNDYDKFNAAMMLGWTGGLFSAKAIKSGEALETIQTLIEMRSNKSIDNI